MHRWQRHWPMEPSLRCVSALHLYNFVAAVRLRVHREHRALPHSPSYADSLTKSKRTTAVHISDMTALYGLIVKKILHSEPPQSGERGYYFAIAHHLHWHDIADHLGTALKTRGLVESEKPKAWTSDEEAAKMLGIPAAFVTPLLNSGYVAVYLANGLLVSNHG
jgi:hypothetical protein